MLSHQDARAALLSAGWTPEEIDRTGLDRRIAEGHLFLRDGQVHEFAEGAEFPEVTR
jgi:hypothetical protein